MFEVPFFCALAPFPSSFFHGFFLYRILVKTRGYFL